MARLPGLTIEAMREGASGIYASVGGAMGYRICMLNKTQMNGNYRDPYLTALVREAGAGGDVIDGERGPFFIGGYVEENRWMYLRKSHTGLHCSADGFVLKPPSDEFLERFHEVCANNFGLDKPLKLVIPQKWRDNRHVDTEDRRPEQVCCVALSPQVSEELPIDLNYVN